MTLAPPAKFTGGSAVEFYVPDARYRRQVFALEDLRDGGVTAYCPDVLADAVAAGLLAYTGRPEPGGYVVAATGEPLHVGARDGAERRTPPSVRPGDFRWSGSPTTGRTAAGYDPPQ